MNSTLRQQLFGCPICYEEDALLNPGCRMIPCGACHEVCLDCCLRIWALNPMPRCPVCNTGGYPIDMVLNTTLKKRQLYEALNPPLPPRPSLDLNENEKIEVHTSNTTIKVETHTSYRPTPPSTSLGLAEAVLASTRTTPCSDCLTFKDMVLAAGGDPSEIADGVVCCASLLRSAHPTFSDSEEGFVSPPTPSTGRATVRGRKRLSFCPYGNPCFHCIQYANALPSASSTTDQILKPCDYRPRPARYAPY